MLKREFARTLSQRCLRAQLYAATRRDASCCCLSFIACYAPVRFAPVTPRRRPPNALLQRQRHAYDVAIRQHGTRRRAAAHGIQRHVVTHACYLRHDISFRHAMMLTPPLRHC
jgi:hypothetical protein